MKITLRKVLVTATALVVTVITGISIPNLFEHLDAKDIMVIQSPVDGKLSVYIDPGIQYQGFGTVTKYPRRSTYSFDATDKSSHQCKHIQFTGREMVKISTLDSEISDYTKYNFINIDVQGYELEVFKGSSNILQYIDYIISEVNRDELYKDCAQIDELDSYLSTFGFERVEIDWVGNTWGDAFYIKK
jgi:hypothetical protein